MTEGQQIAVEQMEDIARSSEGLLEILSYDEKEQWLCVTVSLDCSEYNVTPNGLPIHPRERFLIAIQPDFPFSVPVICTSHKQWMGAPHVQWGDQLCLYQSPATEWDSNDGMFGFFQRLENWLQHAALGELNPTGQPLHPPVTYGTNAKDIVIPQVDTPMLEDNRPWIGFARLDIRSEWRADIIEWNHALADNAPANGALAILLAEEMPYEFPRTLTKLLEQLEHRGITGAIFSLLLRWVALLQDNEQPLRIIIGTPMRGIAGDTRRQHLTAWRIERASATLLANAINTAQCLTESEDDELREGSAKLQQLIHEWAQETKVSWCRVLENRPEIIHRRDTGTPLAWFTGKTVAIWGCGALGSHIAEMLTRAGVSRLLLYDNERVKPGILVRQLFEDRDIGQPKANALADRLRRIRPVAVIEPYVCDLLSGPLAEDDWTNDADIVIDATASRIILAKLESRRAKEPLCHVPVVSIAIGHHALDAMIVLCGKHFSGGPDDVCRRTKIALCERPNCTHFLNEFFPEENRNAPFQPEPGCSENTFLGSSADVALLASAMINALATDLASDKEKVATAHLFRQPGRCEGSEDAYARFEFTSDLVFADSFSGYQIRINPTAWRALEEWIVDSERLRGSESETGGLLFGEYDDVAKIVWVREAIGPPPDSEHSPQLFMCGIEDTREAAQTIAKRSRGSNYYVGMWHTHPNSVPIPSPTDREAMVRLLNETPIPPRRTLLLILGEALKQQSVGAYVFRRSDFEKESIVWDRLCTIHLLPSRTVRKPKSHRKTAKARKRRH